MATAAIVAARAQRAYEKAMEVIDEHGPPERMEALQAITVAQAVPRNPEHAKAFVAELIAALAEVIQDQHRRIEEQDERISALENPPAAVATKKIGKKA